MFLSAPFYFSFFIQGAPQSLKQHYYSPGQWLDDMWKEQAPWAHDKEFMCVTHVNTFSVSCVIIVNVFVAVVQVVAERLEPTIVGAKKRAWDL